MLLPARFSNHLLINRHITLDQLKCQQLHSTHVHADSVQTVKRKAFVTECIIRQPMDLSSNAGNLISEMLNFGFGWMRKFGFVCASNGLDLIWKISIVDIVLKT